MDNIENSILKKNFTAIKPGSGGRYNQDDIITVIKFMVDHPSVHIRSIAEYSGISLGTLVHWRKKFGKYYGIKVKGAKVDPTFKDRLDTTTQEQRDAINQNQLNDSREKELCIPFSLIDELRKLSDRGEKAEMKLNKFHINVDNANVYLSEISDSD